MKVIGQGLDGNYLFSVSKEEIKELLKASGMTDNININALLGISVKKINYDTKDESRP